MRRAIRWLVILGILGGLGYGAFVPLMAWWKERSKQRYLTAKVSKGTVEASVNSTGTVKPVRTVQVGAFVSGPIVRVNVDFNDHVKKDEVLAEIDDKLRAQSAPERFEATEAPAAKADKTPSGRWLARLGLKDAMDLIDAQRGEQGPQHL